MENNKDFSLLQVLTVLYRWRKVLLKVSVAAVVAMVILSFILPVYYTSSVTFVPTDEDDKERIYGQEEANSRVILLASSSTLVQHMVEKFDLYNRYDIDVSNPKAPHYVREIFNKRFRVEKNPFAGIQISVEDKDPAFAAEMLRELLSRLKKMYSDITLETKKQVVNNFELELDIRRKQLQEVTDTLSIIRGKYDIYDVDYQAMQLSTLIVNNEFELVQNEAKLQSFEIGGGARDSVKKYRLAVAAVKSKLEALKSRSPGRGNKSAANLAFFNEGRDQIVYFEKIFENLKNEISVLTEEYAEYRSHIFANVAELIVLEPVEVPTVKSYPVRWAVVAFGSIITVVFAVLGVLVLEFTREVDWKKILNDNAG